eukprot:GHRQ01014270.1.p1 GENE.GHRQ01014270.1~~GHRQ01014270.1.p1  ORF type:complete len:195 (+),score=30.42 GHRQ01014270.1:263-847(+)
MALHDFFCCFCLPPSTAAAAAAPAAAAAVAACVRAHGATECDSRPCQQCSSTRGSLPRRTAYHRRGSQAGSDRSAHYAAPLVEACLLLSMCCTTHRLMFPGPQLSCSPFSSQLFKVYMCRLSEIVMAQCGCVSWAANNTCQLSGSAVLVLLVQQANDAVLLPLVTQCRQLVQCCFCWNSRQAEHAVRHTPHITK